MTTRANDESYTVLVDVFGSAEERHEILDAITELSFEKTYYFRLFGDVPTLHQELQRFAHDSEYIALEASERETRHATIAGLLAQNAHHAWVTASDTVDVGQALRDADALLPHVTRPAQCAIVPVVKGEGQDDRYAVLLDVSGFASTHPSIARAASAQELVAVAEPIARWFGATGPRRVGVLSSEPASRIHCADTLRLLHELAAIEHVDGKGAISPQDLLLGNVDIALTLGAAGPMFVRTLEASFAAANSLIDRETQGVRGKIGVRIFKSRIEKLRDYGNLESYGGSPMLGTLAPVVLVQPDASARAWFNAIRLVRKMHRTEYIAKAREYLDATDTSSLPAKGMPR